MLSQLLWQRTMLGAASPFEISHTITALFLTGLFGGVHCAGMCGGIVTALGLQSRREVSASPVAFVRGNSAAYAAGIPVVGSVRFAAIKTALLYNTGRIMTYVLLGALAGAAGSVGWWMQNALPVQQAFFVLTNVLLLAMGLYVYGIQAPGRLVEKAGGYLWRFIQPAATRQLQRGGSYSALMAGSVWGLVPCGMVYGALLAALLSGSAVRGALLMLAFGLGTLPNMLALGLSAQWMAGLKGNRVLRRFAGLFIIFFAVAGFLRSGIAADIPLLQLLCLPPQ